MLNLTLTVEFMMIALHFMTCTVMLCGILVWIERHENKKQRTYLAVACFMTAAMMMIRLVLTYKAGMPEIYSVLPISRLYSGFWMLLILFLYPLEVVNPGWLKWRTALLLFLPMIIVSIILVVVPIEFRQLYSFGDMTQYIAEPNVWFRLLILFIFIVPYTILLLCVPYNWQYSSVDTKWIKIYVLGVQGVGILYIIFMFTGSVLASTVHLLYCTLLFMYITYQDLYLRLLPATIIHPLLEPIIVPTEAPVPLSIWGAFEHCMKTEKPWLSPNITLSDVAGAIGCSRTTLSATISAQMGTDSFHSIVARYRIDAFCKMAKKGEIDNVNEALFAVGFRSRSTAYERFKEQMGLTPAEYIKVIKKT